MNVRRLAALVGLTALSTWVLRTLLRRPEPDLIAQNAAVQFYERHYKVIASFLLQVGKKQTLTATPPGTCRFCGATAPTATFRKVAHAIPEALGNKSLSTAYECDACNEFFGGGIETELGNWSKPNRTLSQVRGKSGVPTLKKGSDGGWRVEMKESGLNISQFQDDPVVEVDEANKRLIFTLKRDTYTPVAVLKALTKIGLTVVPQDEMPNFQWALSWIRDPDHQASPVEGVPVLETFVPGPMPFDHIALMVVRRKSDDLPVPYALMVLALGNQMWQLPLLSPERDAHMNGQSLTFPAFPSPYHLGATAKGPPKSRTLDLNGRDRVKGEIVKMALHFDSGLRRDRDGSETTV